MELIELIGELTKMLMDRYDEETIITDGGSHRVINRAGRLARNLSDEDNPDINALIDVEEWMEDNEPYLTEQVLSLKSEVNRHICILLTQEI